MPARLAHAYLTNKIDIVNLVKKKDFDEKLENLNKKLTSNKAKHVPVESISYLNYRKS